MPELDPKLVASFAAVAVDVVRWLLHKGDHTATTEDIKRIAREAAEAAVEHAAMSLAEAGMVAATDALAEAANRLQDELRRLDALMPPPVVDDSAGSGA